VRGEGTYLIAEDGKRYIDAISSWWVNLHGHTHPYIVEKVKGQLDILEHVLFAGCSHPPAIELAERLLTVIPGDMSKIFYSDNGSTAVEVALKMALQYWKNRDEHSHVQVISFRGSYHGDTFGAMSAAGKNSFNKPFWSYLFKSISIDPPLQDNRDQILKIFTDIITTKKPSCFIFEPLILGAGGMHIYCQEALSKMVELCRQHNVLTIADEVMTGFGRTGTLFASEKLSHKPDIVCISKGITGGFLPLGVTACNSSIFEVFLSKDPQKSFLHGHSYTANPLACTAALASLDLLQMDESRSARKLVEENHKAFCKRYSNHPRLVRCEYLGTILVVEYKTEEQSSYFHSLRNWLYTYFLGQGILTRPLGNILYILPPYCITETELQYIYHHIAITLELLP
jgi:adenosylmethionine---8-amino-7-oxononanoate aminotransferase